MKQEEDKFRSLFQEMRINGPSESFEDRLMIQIQKEAKKKVLRRSFYTWLSTVAGIAVMIIGPLIYMYITGWELDRETLDINMQIPYINPMIILITVAILSLLVADILIRKHIFDKKHRK